MAILSTTDVDLRIKQHHHALVRTREIQGQQPLLIQAQKPVAEMQP
jgi:hypothetical protein